MAGENGGTRGVPLIADRYRALDTLGRGGMGTVYEAVDTRLDRRVAVKLITAVEGLAADNESLQRFMREARALARIDHPGVVTLYDAGVHGNVPYLVMQVLDGTNLARLVAETGPLPVEVLATVALGVVRALGAAHEAGVLHRDVKPSNVSITSSGRVVLQDFGLARLAGESKVTRTGATVGTPQFMPPEAIRGQRLGPEADLYGVGACMYFMATGQLPFGETQDVGAVVERALGKGVPRLRGMSGGYPDALLVLIDRLCDRHPARRPGPDNVQDVLQPLASHGAQKLADLVAAGPPAGEPVIRESRSRPRRPSRATGVARPPSSVEAPEYPWGPLTVNPRDESAPSEAGLTPSMRSMLTGPPAVDLPSLTNYTRHLVVAGAMTPASALSRQREAVNLVLRGALQDAAEMLSVLVPVCLSSLGPAHPTTLTSQYWQGVCLARLGAGAEALELFAQVNRQVDQQRSPAGE